MEDLPQPPSPQIVMEMGTGGCDDIEADGVCGEGIVTVFVVWEVGEDLLAPLARGGGCKPFIRWIAPWFLRRLGMSKGTRPKEVLV